MVLSTVVDGEIIRTESNQAVNTNPVALHPYRTVSLTRRISLKLTDKCERQIKRTSKVVANAPDDDLPVSVVIDAAPAHLVEIEENIQHAREEYNPGTIQETCDTSVIIIQYRIKIKSVTVSYSIN